MFQATILLCHIALQGPCDRITATDVIIVPGVSSQIPTQCLQQGEAYLAGAPGIDLRGYTARIVCDRPQRVKREVRR